MAQRAGDWYADEHGAPAVLGSEHSGYDSEDVSEVVYIPTRRVGPEDQEARVELRQNGDGQLVMLAYSSLQDLVNGCGEAQPWISVPLDKVYEVQGDTGAQTVLWDIELPAEMRHESDEDKA